MQVTRRQLMAVGFGGMLSLQARAGQGRAEPPALPQECHLDIVPPDLAALAAKQWAAPMPDSRRHADDFLDECTRLPQVKRLIDDRNTPALIEIVRSSDPLIALAGASALRSAELLDDAAAAYWLIGATSYATLLPPLPLPEWPLNPSFETIIRSAMSGDKRRAVRSLAIAMAWRSAAQSLPAGIFHRCWELGLAPEIEIALGDGTLPGRMGLGAFVGAIAAAAVQSLDEKLDLRLVRTALASFHRAPSPAVEVFAILAAPDDPNRDAVRKVITRESIGTILPRGNFDPRCSTRWWLQDLAFIAWQE